MLEYNRGVLVIKVSARSLGERGPEDHTHWHGSKEEGRMKQNTFVLWMLAVDGDKGTCSGHQEEKFYAFFSLFLLLPSAFPVRTFSLAF